MKYLWNMLIELLVSAPTAEISRIMSLLVIKSTNFSFVKRKKGHSVWKLASWMSPAWLCIHCKMVFSQFSRNFMKEVIVFITFFKKWNFISVHWTPDTWGLSLFFKILKFILFLTVVGLHCCMQAFSNCSNQEATICYGVQTFHCSFFHVARKPTPDFETYHCSPVLQCKISLVRVVFLFGVKQV